MAETKALALMYAGSFIDTSLLENGLYSTSTPAIYSDGNTIKLMEERARLLVDAQGKCYFSDAYFENLNKCKLVPVLITIEQNGSK